MRARIVLRTIDLSARQSASWVRFVITWHSNLRIDGALRTSTLEESKDQGSDHRNKNRHPQDNRVTGKTFLFPQAASTRQQTLHTNKKEITNGKQTAVTEVIMTLFSARNQLCGITRPHL